jgi:hypothetical protein
MSMLRLSLVLPFVLAACSGPPDSAHTLDAGPDQPDATVDVPLERAQAGGMPSAITLAGELAYVAVGPRLTVWDLAGDDGPVQLGETPPLPGVLTAIAVSGSHAYVVEHLDLDGHVHVVDVSDPAAPEVVSSLRVTAEDFSVPLDAAIADDQLFVADQEHGVAVLSLADPAAPALVETIDAPGSTVVEIHGDRLYVIGSGFLGASVSVRELGGAHAELGGMSVPDAIGTAITPAGLFLAVGSQGLEIHDLADPALPVERYRDETILSRVVVASGDTAWVPAEDGLYTLDLADPTTITASSALAAPTIQANAGDATGGRLAVLTNRGQLVTFDVTAAAALTHEVEVTLCADCFGVQAVAGDLLIADNVGGLVTAHLADLTGVGRTIPASFVVFEDVVTEGHLAYVADWAFGLRVIDVSDRAAPVQVGQLGAEYASAVALDGDRLYLGQSTNGGVVRVIDVSDPTAPTQLGQLLTAKTMDLEARGRFVYAADESLDAAGGLRIIDVTDPTAPALVGQYTTCTSSGDVDVLGDLAVLACDFDGFHILDITDPAAPVQLAVFTPESGSAEAVALDGHLAYLGHSTGVVVVDLSTPTAPVLVAGTSIFTTWPVRTIDVPFPGRLVATTGPGGVYQLDTR